MDLLICAHGAHGVVGTAADHADDLRRRGVEVGVCCLTGHPSVAEALAGLAAESIVLVPLLMADGYTAQTLLPHALADAGDRRRIIVASPVGLHPGLADLIRERAKVQCRQRNWTPADTTLILVGHGTRRNPKSTETTRRHAAAVRRTHDFADVGVAFLEAAPSLPAALGGTGGRNTIVIGLFADRGVHGEADLPRLLAPYGDAVAYDGPIGVVPDIADIILAQAMAAVRAAAASAEPTPVPLPPQGSRLRQRLLLGRRAAGQLQGDGSRGDDGGLGTRRARVAAP